MRLNKYARDISLIKASKLHNHNTHITTIKIHISRSNIGRHPAGYLADYVKHHPGGAFRKSSLMKFSCMALNDSDSKSSNFLKATCVSLNSACRKFRQNWTMTALYLSNAKWVLVASISKKAGVDYPNSGTNEQLRDYSLAANKSECESNKM